MLPNSEETVLGVGEFVALLNQAMEYAFPSVTISGELANFRVSKNRWVYFDLKDDTSTVKFFGTVYHLPGPLEDGMLLKVRGSPKLHNAYGFSVNIISLQPAGEGTIKRAAQLLQTKLAAEGLFDETRKRSLPYPPERIGLITSKQSAAYADFIKVLQARWSGVEIELADVQVQGEAAPAQLVAAIEQLNKQARPPQAIIMIRGGGSAEDLAAFSTEQVTRAVAASRVPTLVAIGHEVDVSLAELAADKRASTPSNAAELLVPDKSHVARNLKDYKNVLERSMRHTLKLTNDELSGAIGLMNRGWRTMHSQAVKDVTLKKQLLGALSPQIALQRGYAVISDRGSGQTVKSIAALRIADRVDIRLSDGSAQADIISINDKE